MSIHRGKAENQIRRTFEDSTDLKTGMHASRVTNKKGIYANIDRDNMLAKRKQQLAAFGDGKSRFAMVDEDGIPTKDAVFVEGNILFKPNKNGVFSAVHESYLKEQLKIEEEINSYVKKVMGYLVNDKTNAQIFNMSDTEYTKIFGTSTKADFDNIGLKDISPEVMKIDCTASYMQMLLRDSAAFHASANKLYLLTRHFMPMITMSSETHEQSEADGEVNPMNEGEPRRPTGILA